MKFLNLYHLYTFIKNTKQAIIWVIFVSDNTNSEVLFWNWKKIYLTIFPISLENIQTDFDGFKFWNVLTPTKFQNVKFSLSLFPKKYENCEINFFLVPKQNFRGFDWYVKHLWVWSKLLPQNDVQERNCKKSQTKCSLPERPSEFPPL